MPRFRHALPGAAILALVLSAALPASATVKVTVKIQNLAQAGSISFAPLRIGFNSGVFDAFNAGTAATAPIVSIAEGGSGSAWFPAFAAADSDAVLGSVGGALTPGATASATGFVINPVKNPFFTFASMVLPSNDFFIGNDDPREYRLFDNAGHLLIGSIDLLASDIWNAGSEAFDPANAAFVQGGVNALRTPENGVVGFNFAELSNFDGLTTAAGYVFKSGLQRDTPVYRITFSTTGVPEPATWTMMLLGFGSSGWMLRRRRAAQRLAFAMA